MGCGALRQKCLASCLTVLSAAATLIREVLGSDLNHGTEAFRGFLWIFPDPPQGQSGCARSNPSIEPRSASETTPSSCKWHFSSALYSLQPTEQPGLELCLTAVTDVGEHGSVLG
jgi:hypothetical protein